MSSAAADLFTELMPCVRCGQCRSVCPVFVAKGVESDSPRGRLALVRALLEGKIEANELLAEKIEQCALCRACLLECPSGVHVERIILAARERLARVRGIPLQKRILTRWFFPHLNRLAVFLPLASRMQGLLGSQVLGGEYRWPRVQLPVVGKRLLPNLRGQTIHKPIAETEEVPPAQGKAALFLGCMIGYGYPRVGRAVLEVLRRNGVRGRIPRDQICCGLPALAAGDQECFARVRQQNLRILRATECDIILTACASCGSTLKEYYQSELSVPIYDFTELVADRIQFRPPRGRLKGRITYHDPCHLRKAQGIKDPPRRLLKSIPGVSYQEVADPDRCCGFGGTFSLSYPSLSEEMGATKIHAVMETGADLVATACPGCMLHLANGLFRAMSKARVVHVSELLAAAYREASPPPLE
ncbi:MAG: (Fe-S)-binding protein [candidate division NC10 bacterium]|nr:(Fe-S)-binding protein [candidate division NC10 bacterium]